MASRGFVSLGIKLAALTVAVVVVVSAFVYFELTRRERESLVGSKAAAGAMVSDLFAATVVPPLDFGDAEGLESDLRNLRSNPDVVYAAIRPIAGGAPVVFGAAPAHDEPSDAAPDAESNGVTLRSDRVIVDRKVVGPTGKLLGSVSIHFSLARENAAFEAGRKRILILSIGFAIAVGALVLGVVRLLVVSPLTRLLQGAQRLEAGGGLEGRAMRVDVRANDEIGRLARAFNAAAAAIADREDRLASARASLQELFDHLRQGVLVFGSDGRVEGMASRQALTIFSGGAETLEAKSIRELLYPGAPDFSVDAQAFDEWLAAAFRIDPAAWNDLAELAPREVVVDRDGTTRVLSLEFRPVVREGEVKRVMLLVTDETEKRALERAMASKDREHDRQMRAMRRLLAGGAFTLAQFLGGIEAKLASWRALLDRAAGDDDDGKKARGELRMAAHTTKGEARILDLAELAAELARIEDPIAKLATAPASERAAAIEAVRAGLVEVEAAALRARDLFIEASPIGVSALDQMPVRRSEVLRLAALTRGRDDEIARGLRLLASRPFGEIVDALREQAPAWAEAVGKRAVVEIAGKDAPIDIEHVEVLRGALTHLIRNAIAHGIERADARGQAGKPLEGKIILDCRRDAYSTEVLVQDDGGGFDLEGLMRKARERGLEVGGDATRLAFVDGLSTTEGVGELAGRGIGLAAVERDLASIGWTVEIASTEGRGARVVARSKRSDVEGKGA